MSEIIENYIGQIAENLRLNSIKQNYIDEFIDNLRDQLYIQIEEIQKQKPGLNSKEVEIQVLTKCEPIEIVVNRVIKELQPETPKVRIEQFSETRTLKFFQRMLFYVSVKIENLIFHIKRLRLWYWRNKNPALTSLLYFGIIFLLMFLTRIVSMIFPALYYVTVFPSNKTFLSFSDSPPSLDESMTVTFSVTNVSTLVWSILASLIILGILIYLGWSYSSSYAIKSSILLSALISISLYFSKTEISKNIIKFRTIDPSFGIAYTQDWITSQKPSLGMYFEYQVQTILASIITITPFIVLMVLLGLLIKTIKNEKLNRRTNIIKYSIPSVLILIFVILAPSMIATVRFPTRTIPIPSHSDGPIYYNFEIDWTSKYSGRNFSESYKTSLSMFGNISFYFHELYNVSLLDEPSIRATAELEPSTFKSEEQSDPSSSPFVILGLLYLPIQVNNRSWQDLIGQEINSSFPFKGYTPTVNLSLDTIKWFANGSWVNLNAYTITYNSNTNNSVFNFCFDVETGWLLKATLNLENDTWVTGFDLNELVISRRFVYNTIRDPEKYYSINTIIEATLLVIILVIFIFSLNYYYKHPLKINNR